MKMLLYCTKTKKRLFFDKIKQIFSLGKIKSNNDLNGKIVAECDFEVEKLQIVYGKGWETKTIKGTENIEKLTCLSRDKLYQYCKGNGYAIHIKNLHIFDKPKKLSDYMNGRFEEWDYRDLYELEKAPQNMQYVSTWYCDEISMCGNTYILISIQPQWLCKILNGEKTIEVRKVVLKEMIRSR